MSPLASSPDVEPCFCTAVRQAARRLSQFYDAALAPLAIGVNQYAVLARLERLGPQTIRALAAELVMDRSTLGHLVRPLAARGLLRLASPAQDRRRRMLTLTGTGASVLAEGRPLWDAAQRHFETSYGATAARQLRAMLDDVSALPLPPLPRPAAQP